MPANYYFTSGAGSPSVFTYNILTTAINQTANSTGAFVAMIGKIDNSLSNCTDRVGALLF